VCLVVFDKLNMGRVEVLCPSHHKYLDPRSHRLWHLTRTVPLSPSHRVVYLVRTVLLTSVLLLSGLSLAQCKRSTLIISSHTLQRDVFLCLTARSHSVFFIVYLLTHSHCGVPISPSHNVVFLDQLFCNPPQCIFAVLHIPTLQ